MKTLQLTFLMVLALLLSSCTMNFGTKGNGHLVTQDRNITDDFTGIISSAGIDVFLTQGDQNKVVVETDENLQEYIETSVRNGTLRIETSKNIRWAKARKVYVTYKELDNIEATSGSNIQGNSVIKSQNLFLKASSGAEIEVEVFSQDLNLNASSGSEMKISGKSSSLTVQASSGSEIDAKRLAVINCIAKASSGAEIEVNVKEKIDAKASSGGEINYYGNPTFANAQKSSSGSVKKQ